MKAIDVSNYITQLNIYLKIRSMHPLVSLYVGNTWSYIRGEAQKLIIAQKIYVVEHDGFYVLNLRIFIFLYLLFWKTSNCRNHVLPSAVLRGHDHWISNYHHHHWSDNPQSFQKENFILTMSKESSLLKYFAYFIAVTFHILFKQPRYLSPFCLIINFRL